MDRFPSRATSLAHAVRYSTKMPDAREMAATESLDMFVDLGREALRRRRMQAAGGSNSMLADGVLDDVVGAAVAFLGSVGVADSLSLVDCSASAGCLAASAGAGGSCCVVAASAVAVLSSAIVVAVFS